MIDPHYLSRLMILNFALKRRLLDLCEIPHDALEHNFEAREEFVPRLKGVLGVNAKRAAEEIRAGTFENSVLIHVALKEKKISQKAFKELMNLDDYCNQKGKTGLDIGSETEAEFDEAELVKWEKYMNIQK